MKVLAGGPARETTSALFKLHQHSLGVQSGWGHLRTELQIDVEVRHELVPDDGGPRWHHEKIERVAKAREGMISAYHGAWVDDPTPVPYDALFLVDTDIVLGPKVLRRMMDVDADVVYGVFWTEADWGQPEGEEAPNVWRSHPYNFDRQTWDALKAKGVNEVEVYGGGACTLIRGRGFESHYWPLLEGIRYAGGMWAGEDRTFNIGLECRGIKQVAVTGLPIYHCHHPHQQTPEHLQTVKERVGL